MSNPLQQAVAAHQSGNIPEAERLYREVLAAAPQNADALALLGVVRGIAGAHEEAVDLVKKAVALDPKSALFRFHLGSVLMNASRLPEAIAEFRQAVSLQPRLAPAWYNLGNALRAAGDWNGALEAYRAAIRINPNYAEAYNNLALTLVHEKKLDEALGEAKRAVAVAPDYGEGWRTLCNIAESVREYPLALEAGEQCIRLMPDSHYAWFGYGVALNRLDRNEEAIEAYRRALALKPERADIWDNLGQTYQALNRLEEAEATFRKTVEVAGQAIAGDGTREIAEEEYGNRHWHLALMELLRGKYKQGFSRYRSRFKDVGGLHRPNFKSPVWKGENLAGKTIVISDEQGFGDTLMMCRYMPLIKEQGARIVFSMHPALKGYFTGWPAADEIVTHGEKLPPFDYHASVFDLPHIFGTTLETIPANVPYLPLPGPDAETDLERLQSQGGLIPPPLRGRLGGGSVQQTQNSVLAESTPPLAPPSGGGEQQCLKVGVVWGGNPLHSNDARRSVPLAVFAHLFDIPGIAFYSLNRDMKPGDAELLAKLPVIDLAPHLTDFRKSAQYIGQLDLIIAVDTSTAHLAGGMGKKAWTLLPFAPDWRWLTGRTDSVWYPTMRLFRQPKPSDWASVIAEVKGALAQEVSG